MMKSILSFLFFSFTFLTFAEGEGIPEPRSKDKLVHNLSKEFPNFLTPSEEAQLEAKLSTFAAKTSNQILVVIVDDLNGMEPWAYATELGQKWKIGQGNLDNGVVLLIKPTGGQNQRKTEIAVGYGLESVIPDLTAKQIVDSELLPNFKRGAYYQGIDQATTVIMQLAIGEYNSDEYAKKKDSPLAAFIVIAVIFIFIFFAFRNRGGGGGDAMGMSSRGFFYGAMMGGMMGGRGGHSGGGFGGGGGGFGGFGGGGFGGGGAGGSW